MTNDNRFLVEIIKPMSSIFTVGMVVWCRLASNKKDFTLISIDEITEQPFKSIDLPCFKNMINKLYLN